MSRTILDIHVLQTVPPSNLNRDDTGSPKTATYGGVRRARVSSQAWKRATRTAFQGHLDATELGTRTKRVVELVGARIAEISTGHTTENALAAAAQVLKEAGIKTAEPRGKAGAPAESGYLLFLSAQQIEALAQLGADSLTTGVAPTRALAQPLVKGKNSIDLALFGRMVADVSDLNVDAACQVAHAISTHKVDNEFDYYTAVDDHKAADAEEDAGAGMIGTVEFNSSTLYRYATVDVDRLHQNLGDAAATERAVAAFLRSFVTSMPTGKQNTFANRTVPDAVVVSLREDQPVSLVGAFEEPVPDSLAGGRVAASVDKLVAQARDVEAAFLSSAVQTWTVGVGPIADRLAPLGSALSFAALVEAATATVSTRLQVADTTDAT
ncbi:type I-E CRISPR-associated protein Cas7/Cse4/CasC [Oerskovia flava]|uniref:type I-E CRISPR-associated protein Cas7/Cse4/CasC n=1 Tax=Oerskovia flava TaxID=2986422 RepID=UPI00223F3F5E|nr:type I-E CRISPR-associated protein Cas7/Cse4/CasC [Oerskovia sp. JB1-3-2]